MHGLRSEAFSPRVVRLSLAAEKQTWLSSLSRRRFPCSLLAMLQVKATDLLRVIVVVGFLGISAACRPAPVGVDTAPMSKDSGQACASQCASLGLVLDSVVLMAEHVGCVCRPPTPQPGAPGAVTRGPAGAAAGAMTVVLARQAAAAQQATAASASRRR